MFDARGSGVSEGEPPFTHEQWVADVDALREWAGVEQFVIAGGSYGGFIAMEYGIRYPERLTAMVLLTFRRGFVETPWWRGSL